MKRAVLLAVGLFACSTPSPSNTADSGPDASSSPDGADEVSPDADPNTPYEHAVMNTQWQKLANGPSVGGGAKQDDIFFLDPMLGFAASGPNWSIFKTTDGGTSWKNIFTKQGTYFRAVLFLDAMHGFAGNIGAGLSSQITDTNALYETLDGGTSWNPVTKITGPAPAGICNLTAVDATHLFAVGRANGPSHILSSSDAGATWTSIDVSSKLSMLVDAHFTSPMEGVVVGMGTSGRCTVLRTGDGGTTLTPVFTSKTPNSLCWKVQFPSASVGYVAVQDAGAGPPTFAKTIDGGMSWNELPLPIQSTKSAPYPAIGIGFITDNVGWVSPEEPTLPTYRTVNGGETWDVDATLESPINRFRFVDKNTAYAIGANAWKLSVPWQ